MPATTAQTMHKGLFWCLCLALCCGRSAQGGQWARGALPFFFLRRAPCSLAVFLRLEPCPLFLTPELSALAREVVSSTRGKDFSNSHRGQSLGFLSNWRGILPRHGFERAAWPAPTAHRFQPGGGSRLDCLTDGQPFPRYHWGT